MTELFYLMTGACSMFWCSFTYLPDTEMLEVRVNNTVEDMIKVRYIPYADLYDQLPEKECIK